MTFSVMVSPPLAVRMRPTLERVRSRSRKQPVCRFRCPGLKLCQCVRRDVIALKILRYLLLAQAVQGGVEVYPVGHANEVGLDRRLQLRFPGDHQPTSL